MHLSHGLAWYHGYIWQHCASLVNIQTTMFWQKRKKFPKFSAFFLTTVAVKCILTSSKYKEQGKTGYNLSSIEKDIVLLLLSLFVFVIPNIYTLQEELQSWRKNIYMPYILLPHGCNKLHVLMNNSLHYLLSSVSLQLIIKVNLLMTAERCIPCIFGYFRNYSFCPCTSYKEP